MSEREELTEVIEAVIRAKAPAIPDHIAQELGCAAADAILARRNPLTDLAAKP